MKQQNATMLGLLAGSLLAAPLLHPAPAAAVQYEDPVLVADLDPGRIPDPLEPRGLTVVGDRLYFVGDNTGTGREPWVSDGTAAGTRMLADLCPGPCSSGVAGFGEIGGQLVLVVQVGNEIRLLKETGSELETVIALAGATGTFFQLGGQVFFAFNEAPRPDLIYGSTTLMASDGTAAGTVAVATLCSGPVCGPGYSAARSGDAVYVLVPSSYSGTQILKLVAGQPVQTIASFGQFVGVDSLRALDSQRVVLRAQYVLDLFSSVWIYEPGAGTHLVDPPSGFADAMPRSYFVTWRGRLYYRNSEGDAVTTDGAAGNLRLATELTGPSPYVLGSTANHLYYTAGEVLRVHRADGSDQALLVGPGDYAIAGAWGERVLISRSDRLFATDGTLAGTVELPGVSVSGGVPFGGAFYFAGSTTGGPDGLWRTDGSAAGTYEIATGSTGPSSSGARPYVVGSKLIVDTPAAAEGRQLWRVDPQTFAAEPISAGPLVPLANNGTVMLAKDPSTRQVYAVRDEGPPLALPLTGIVQSLGARVAVAPDGRFFFTEYSDGQELWESDGTVAGTRQLFDLDPSWTSPCFAGSEDCDHELPGAITPAGNQVFFVGRAPGAPLWENGLWVYDRGSGEVRQVALPDDVPFSLQPWSRLTAVGSRLAFHSTDSSAPMRELWQTDGVNATPFGASFEPVDLETAVAGRLFYRDAGRRLVVSDLAGRGTVLLAEPDLLLNLARVGDHLVHHFQENGEMRLGWSDGTPAGTTSVAIPGFDNYGSFDEFLPVGDRQLAFTTSLPLIGPVAYVSDGTPAGTLPLGDAGIVSSPRYLAAHGNRLFFQGGDIAHGRELWAVDLPAPKPSCPADKLCLRGGRFEVSVEVRPPDGVRQGQRALATSESGVFTFFTPDNWEFLVKVLDGCSINGQFWVYAAAATDVAYTLKVLDRATGATRTYANPAGQAARSILDGNAFAGCAAEAPPPLYAPAHAPPPVVQRCGDDLEELCLGGGRYRVSATWRTATESGKAHAIVNGSADSGLFSFFSPSNWELMVKVLDGCPLNGRRWIFAAGTTDVGFTLRVEDLETGEVKVYENPVGKQAVAITDSSALGGCS